MATPRSRDGTRPRSKSGTAPSTPRSSDLARQSPRSPVTSSPAAEKPMPSFLRPTVSSSLHSSSTSKSPVAPRRSTDKSLSQPVTPPRPITPKDKAKAASSSRWSSVSPRQLMQRASNAIKGSKSSGKKKEGDSPVSASSKASEASDAFADTEKSETASIQSTEEHLPEDLPDPVEPKLSEPAVDPPPPQAEEVVEPKDEKHEQQEASSQEVVTDITTIEERVHEEEQAAPEEPKGEVEKEEIVAEKLILEESSNVGAETVKVETPEEEEKSLTGINIQTATETIEKVEDEPSSIVVEEAVEETPQEEEEPSSIVVEEAVKETPKGEEEPSSSVVSETVVKEVKAEEEPEECVKEAEEADATVLRQEEEPKPEELNESSEVVVTSEEPKVTTVEKHEAVPEKAMVVESSTSEPAPATEAVNKEKEIIAEPLPKESRFEGSKVKTAMEKRADDEQPKKKEVVKSNDVIEETRSKLLEKKRSKVKALVGAFETVMDSQPGKSS